MTYKESDIDPAVNIVLNAIYGYSNSGAYELLHTFDDDLQNIVKECLETYGFTIDNDNHLILGDSDD